MSDLPRGTIWFTIKTWILGGNHAQKETFAKNTFPEGFLSNRFSFKGFSFISAPEQKKPFPFNKIYVPKAFLTFNVSNFRRSK